MKRLSLFIMVALFACALTACNPDKDSQFERAPAFANNENDPYTSGMIDLEDEPYSHSGAAESDSASHDGIPVSEASYYAGIFKLSADGGTLIPLDTLVEVNMGAKLVGDGIDGQIGVADLLEGGASVMVDRSKGEQLVVVAADGEPRVDMWPAFESGYYQGSSISGNPADYDEIGGVSTSSPSFSLAEFGVKKRSMSVGNGYFLYMITYPEPTALEASWYSGTAWKEGHIRLGTPYCLTLSDEMEIGLPLTPTRDGYFIVDTGGFEAGVYVFKSTRGEGDYFVVQLVDGPGSTESASSGAYG